MTEKKVWVEPELLVLVRNRPEEAILGVCKYAIISANPQVEFEGCATSPLECWDCQLLGFS